MESTESVLARWQQQAPEELPAGRIKTDPAYQPRDITLAPFRDRARLERDSEKHISRLAECISAGPLDPLLVARIGAELFVVDGHHRLRAYKRASRRQVAARVLSVTPQQAWLVSKLVNCSGAKLALHAEQARECVWQTLAHLTEQGRIALPPEMSARALGRAYGTSHETVRTMVRRLQTVKVREYGPTACDPGTGWPRWRYVKENAIRSRFADVPDDIREQHRDAKFAAKLAAMIEKDGIATFLRSVALLRDEAVREAAEQLAEALPADSNDY